MHGSKSHTFAEPVALAELCFALRSDAPLVLRSEVLRRVAQELRRAGSAFRRFDVSAFRRFPFILLPSTFILYPILT